MENKYYSYWFVNDKNKSLYGDDKAKDQIILNFFPLVNEMIWVSSEEHHWGSREKEHYRSELILKVCEVVKAPGNLCTSGIVRKLEGHLRRIIKRGIITTSTYPDRPDLPETHFITDDLPLLGSYFKDIMPGDNWGYILVSHLFFGVSRKELASELGITKRRVGEIFRGALERLKAERDLKTPRFLKLVEIMY